MVTPCQPKYTATEIKNYPSVDARRQVPHPLIYIELTEFHPVDGVRHISGLIPEQEKKNLVGLTLTVCYKRNGPPRATLQNE